MALFRALSDGGGGGANMQSGEITKSNSDILPSSQILNGGTVSFDTPFSTIPKVYVRTKFDSGDYNGTQYVCADAYNVSTTGFSLSFAQSYTGATGHSVTIEWVAYTD